MCVYISVCVCILVCVCEYINVCVLVCVCISVNQVHVYNLVHIDVLQGKWTNKERVLVFFFSWISFKTRHLMMDLRTMMPHTKAGKPHQSGRSNQIN